MMLRVECECEWRSLSPLSRRPIPAARLAKLPAACLGRKASAAARELQKDG